MALGKKQETRTTTVRLPRPLYDQIRGVVEKEKGVSGSSSLNDFFISAIKAYLQMYRRHQIDAAFAGMADDTGYQNEAELIAEEFEHSDWEALRLEERDLEGEPAYATSFTR
jgi:Arc/MetJ-type ribon-helix-helix transcriptional regulator